MKMKSFEIALSAIACAVAAASLTLGSYVDFMLAAGYLIAVFAIMVPLSKNFPAGAVLAHIGGVLLAFFFCGMAIWTLLPYAVFFGLHPIANHFEKKFLKKKWQYLVLFPLKAAWFCLSMWLMWQVVLVPVFGVESAPWYPYVAPYFFIFLFVGGTLFFVFYDIMIFLCQRSVDLAVRRIGR